MTRLTVITSAEDVSSVVDVIHDCWFEKDDITYDLSTRLLRIKFRKQCLSAMRTESGGLFYRRSRVPLLECWLKIQHVKEYSVDDRAQVGRYDFDQLSYEAATKTVRITAGVPITIKALVDRFEVSVEQTDTVSGEIMRTSVLGILMPSFKN